MRVIKDDAMPPGTVACFPDEYLPDNGLIIVHPDMDRDTTTLALALLLPDVNPDVLDHWLDACWPRHAPDWYGPEIEDLEWRLLLD